jgi:hypothetical protein
MLFLSTLKRKFLFHSSSMMKKNQFKSHRYVQANIQADLDNKILNCRLFMVADLVHNARYVVDSDNTSYIVIAFSSCR